MNGRKRRVLKKEYYGVVTVEVRGPEYRVLGAPKLMDVELKVFPVRRSYVPLLLAYASWGLCLLLGLLGVFRVVESLFANPAGTLLTMGWSLATLVLAGVCYKGGAMLLEMQTMYLEQGRELMMERGSEK